jgi:hypothetical protein
MPTYHPSNSDVLVFTFKEGLLSALAHDLKIKVTQFSFTEEGGNLKGSFDATSLRVVNAMKDGAEAPSLLDPAKHHPEIEKNIVGDVLQASKFPSVTFEGKVVGQEVVGNLSLHGVTREIRGSKREDGGQVIVEFKLNQADFGIKPFSAMLGALKVKPELLVRVALAS